MLMVVCPLREKICTNIGYPGLDSPEQEIIDLVRRSHFGIIINHPTELDRREVR